MRMSKKKKKPEAEMEEPVTEEGIQEEVAEEKEPTPEEVIADLQEQLNQAKNDYARAYADTENMKKRLQKEADTAKKYRFQQAGLELLPVMDNMRMALDAQTENTDVETYVKGFEMIYKQLQRILESEGIKEIEAEGKAFDPATMQALMQEQAEGVESGMVLEVLQKGYMLKDRILRPALVKVSE